MTTPAWRTSAGFGLRENSADPGGILRDGAVPVAPGRTRLRPLQEDGRTLHATFSGSAVGTAGMVIRAWNVHGEITTVQVIDALRVVPARWMVVQSVEDPTESGSGTRGIPNPCRSRTPAARALQVIRIVGGIRAGVHHRRGSAGHAGIGLSRGRHPKLDDDRTWTVLVAKELVSQSEQFRTALEYVLEAR